MTENICEFCLNAIIAKCFLLVELCLFCIIINTGCYWNAGRQEQADAVLAALEVLPEPHRSMIRTLVDVCAYAGMMTLRPLL